MGLSGLQEGQAEFQVSMNLLGDFGCLFSLSFASLLGRELSKVGKKVCSNGGGALSYGGQALGP